MKITHEQIQHLLDAPDYREFMRRWIAEKSKIKKFGFSDIARNGGFAARSFPRDVSSGAKNLTLQSLVKMSKGMGLTADLAEYFRLLVALENPDCRLKDISEIKLNECLENLKLRLLQKHGISIETKSQAYASRNAPQVYAALGDKNKGSTIAEIQAKTSLSEEEVDLALQFMLNIQLIERKKNRYFLNENHVNVEGLKTHDSFKKYFLYSTERSMRAAAHKFNSDEALFLSSAFSVKKSDLPKLKDDLRRLLLSYIDNSEKAEGDKVVSLVTGLF